MTDRNPRIIKRNKELWKPIEGFPGYEISNMGLIKSLKRIIERNNGKSLPLPERLLKPTIHKDGYHLIHLRRENKTCPKLISIIVIQHFGKPKPSTKHECNHKDGDKSNNWDNNLEWMTPQENVQHAHATGLIQIKGENHPGSKLTEKEVKKIRSLYATGKYTYIKISKIFGISPINIGNIIRNETWRHI